MSGILDIATGGLLGGAVDSIIQPSKDRQQRKQLELTGRDAMQREREMAEIYYDLSMKKFNETGYEAHRKQLEDAGLNAGLLYGMGGTAGGQSTATKADSEGTTNAQPNNTGAGMTLGLQSSLQQAQIENIKADTNKKNVETTKLSGADTEKILEEIKTLGKGRELTNAQITEVASRLGVNEAQVRNLNAGTTRTETLTPVEKENIQTDTGKKEAETNRTKTLTPVEKQNIQADTGKKGAETQQIKQATQKIIADIANGKIQLNQKDIELYQGEWKIRNETTRIKIETELRKMGLDVDNKRVMNEALKTIIIGGSILNGMPTGARPVIGY